MQRGTPKILCSLLALAWGATALAQPTEDDELALVYGDKATVSIATGSKQLLRRAPAVATVITAEDIAATGATDLDQVLETVPGLHVNHNPSLNTSQYVIRGVYSLYTPQVLMLQNGIPMTTLLVGGKGTLWGGLPLENVARIEVIRGPGSALYGADAYSGAINVITKTAADINGTEVGGRVGSFHSRDAWALHGGALGAVDVAAYLRSATTDGFKRAVNADAQTRNDTLFGTHASLAPGQTNTSADSVDAGLDLAYGQLRWRNGYKLRDNLGSYIGLGSALDPVGRGMSERITSDLAWTDNQLTQNLGLTLGASFMQYKQRFPVPADIYPAGAKLPTGVFTDGMIGGPETSERQVRLSAAVTYGGFADHNIRLGVGRDDLDLYDIKSINNFIYSATGVPIPNGPVIISPLPFITPHRRTVNYLYVQHEWSFARDWALTWGVRHDNYSDAGATNNPRVALVWDAALNVTAKLLYGRAFRAPNFGEEYSTNNPIASGNANLKPETNRTVEAALSWQAAPALQLGVNFFHYAMQDVIRTVANPAPVPGTTYQNTGGQHGDGMELEAMWDAGRNLRLSSHYSAQQSIDEATGKDAGYAPHHHLYARADWRFSGAWQASTQVNWVADRKRAVGDNRPAIPDYTTVDLTLRTMRGKSQWNFAASLRNLFNADVRDPSLAPGLTLPNDLPQAPRTFYLQTSYAL